MKRVGDLQRRYPSSDPEQRKLAERAAALKNRYEALWQVNRNFEICKENERVAMIARKNGKPTIDAVVRKKVEDVGSVLGFYVTIKSIRPTVELPDKEREFKERFAALKRELPVEYVKFLKGDTQ
jgi:hypothetical protein